MKYRRTDDRGKGEDKTERKKHKQHWKTFQLLFKISKRSETTDSISSMNLKPDKVKEEYLIYIEGSTRHIVHKLISHEALHNTLKPRI